MLIPHDALILVADGEKFLFLRNRGAPEQPVLEVETSGVQPGQATHEQGADQPGRTFASVGTRRSAVDQTDFHRLEKDQFAAKVAALLADRARSDALAKLIVVAPPHTLAELRQHYDRTVAARLLAEMDKDLTGHPVDEIARILSATGS